MKRTTVVAAAIFLFAGVAQAAAPLPGTPLALLAHVRVQKELKLTADQSATLSGLAQKVEKGESTPADALAKAKKSLNAKQFDRLKEISYQVRGGSALLDEEVATALKLTKKQSAEAQEIWKEEERKLLKFLMVARFRSLEAMLAHKAKHRQKAAARMLGVLSAEQKKQMTTMQGRAFETDGLDLK